MLTQRLRPESCTLTPSKTMDRRGLSTALVFVVFGGLVLYGMTWLVLNPTAQQMFMRGVNSGDQTAAQGATWMLTLWNYSPLIVLIALGTYLLNRAVFESRGGAA